MTSIVRFQSCSIAALLLTFTACSAAPLPAKHATVELLSKQTELAPASTALLGLHFVLEPGWHIYWKNPGDSGQPPALQWQVPDGFSPGEIQWPLPERLQASPALADYGYAHSVLLLVPMRVGAALVAGSTAQILLNAKWLICREVCLPDRAELKFSLPVGPAAKDNPLQAKLFAAAERSVPKPLPRGWKAVAVLRKNTFSLQISLPGRLNQAQFFPADPGQIDNAAHQVVQPAPKGVSLELKKSDLLLKPITVLRGVLALGDGRAYEVEAPVLALGR
jgi:DsbC/DsbD-like thiol-disulfide interchange protein